MGHEVFISYASADKHIAFAICHSLEERNIRCWIAPRDVVPGVNYGKAIIEAINTSQVMILVFSSGSNSSQQVLREVERAVSKGVFIVPLRVEDVLPSDDLEYYISTTHWLDALTQPIEEHLASITGTVESIILKLNNEGGDTKEERKGPSISRDNISYRLGRELSLFTLYGIEATKGGIWITKALHDLDIRKIDIIDFLEMDEKKLRIKRFSKLYCEITSEMRKHLGETRKQWFDLGLNIVTITAVLSGGGSGLTWEDLELIKTLRKDMRSLVRELESHKEPEVRGVLGSLKGLSTDDRELMTFMDGMITMDDALLVRST